jgi:hypothetical protein
MRFTVFVYKNYTIMSSSKAKSAVVYDLHRVYLQTSASILLDPRGSRPDGFCVAYRVVSGGVTWLPEDGTPVLKHVWVLILVMNYCNVLHWVPLLVEVLIAWHRAVLYVAWYQCQTWNYSFDPEDGGSMFFRNVLSTYNTTRCQDPDHNLNISASGISKLLLDIVDSSV